MHVKSQSDYSFQYKVKHFPLKCRAIEVESRLKWEYSSKVQVP